MLGITFKENCPDIRNSRVVDIIQELKSFGVNLDIFDPHADATEVRHEYGVDLTTKPGKKYHAIVLAVAHDEFKTLDISSLKHPNAVVYDVKGIWPKSDISARL